MRPIVATISQSALRHNLNAVKKLAPHAKVMAVVKANGYGHGLLNVAHGLNAADGFAVLGINEAIDLREAGFNQTILLLEGVFNAQELGIAASFNLDVVVHALPQLAMLESAKLHRKLNIHLKLNTGMNRLGFTAAQFSEVYQRLSACQNVASITLMTHFATADEAVGITSALQQFKTATQTVAAAHAVSLANSAAILRHPEAYAEVANVWVRPGIMLYGASPVGDVPAAQYSLKPVMQLTSEIISIQTLQAGQSVGYGNRFTATQPTRVGVVACGYADGYPRHAGQSSTTHEVAGAPIAVNGQLTRTIGRVAMDMLFVDLSHLPEANIGAPVELWGNQVPVESVAQACGTIGYELLCAVSQRVCMKGID